MVITKFNLKNMNKLYKLVCLHISVLRLQKHSVINESRVCFARVGNMRILNPSNAL